MSVEKLDMRAPTRPDPLRVLAEHLPRPLRFLGVGGLGLTTDICVFTILIGYEPRPLLMRLFSLAAATLVTWRLNRALTFDQSGRNQGEEHRPRNPRISHRHQRTDQRGRAGIPVALAWCREDTIIVSNSH